MWLDIPTSSSGPILSSDLVSLFFLLTLMNFNNFIIPIQALLDLDASTNFIDKKFANLHSIPLVLKQVPINVEVIDGWLIALGIVINYKTTPLSITVVSKTTIVSFNVIESSCFGPLILDLSCLIEFNPLIN